MNLSSASFESDETIPTRHTCDGQNVSPSLSWDSVPEGTEALVLVCDDPDAPGGVFTHWLLYNISPELRALPEGLSPVGETDEYGVEGRNDFGNLRYEGPCPPAGPAHRYYFRLYAVDAPLELTAGASRQQLFDALSEREVLDETDLLGRHGRST
ncbi:MAG: YbhB/YbcL family Raf kinase inhibitor-like protein [Candidatus Promineifilaceae bacterium]|nr:YbhB/YbcL family Raf kinase inhibitor-like protein [Candidatus Promineifilaceae bacterium]